MSWLRDRAARRQAKVGEIARLLRGEPAQPQAFCAAPTWRQRLLAKLFPRTPLKEMAESEGFAPGYLETHVITRLDWKDRLRVVVAGQLHTCIRTKTDVTVGKSVSHASTWVEPARNP